MLDLGSMEVWLDCPRCGFGTRVTVDQVRLRAVVICRGCKVTIRLEDHHNQIRVVMRNVRRMISKLAKEMEELSFEIKL